MKKKMKKFLKKIGKEYMKGINEMYGPCLRCGVNPFI